jgi:hypothetical protein
MKGTVVHEVKVRGFVIVQGDGEAETRFAHAREFVNQQEFDRVQIGNRVEFDPFTNEYGKGNKLRAGKVRRVE